MNPYLPVLIFLVFGLVFGCLMTGLSNIAGPLKKRRYATKYEPYECGVPLVSSAREKMSVKYYLTAILFILFDIETVFLYLWAKTFKSLGFFGLIEILLFMIVLVVGYIHVLKKGALEWD